MEEFLSGKSIYRKKNRPSQRITLEMMLAHMCHEDKEDSLRGIEWHHLEPNVSSCAGEDSGSIGRLNY